MKLVRPLAKKYANKPREKKKQRKQINKIVEKEREIQKLIYSIKPKNYVTSLSFVCAETSHVMNKNVDNLTRSVG